MEVYLNRNPSSSHNFGFVTYYSREAAGRAICDTHNRPPLNLVVNYCRKTAAKEQELQQKLQEICQTKPVENDEELDDDWDTEIQREEEMVASLDKFREDYSSGDEEIPVDKVKRLPVVSEEKDETDFEVTDSDAPNASETINKTPKKPPCNRCGVESKFVCKGCSLERYCSAACQSLEWPLHRTRCSIRPDLKSEDLKRQDVNVTAQIDKENLPSPVNVDSVDWISTESNINDDSAEKLLESSKASAEDCEKDSELLTLRNQLQKAKIGESNSSPFLTNSTNSTASRTTSPHTEHNKVYFEKDLAESKLDLWSEETEVLLLEVEGRWALVRPYKGTERIFQLIVKFPFHDRWSVPYLGEGTGRC